MLLLLTHLLRSRGGQERVKSRVGLRSEVDPFCLPVVVHSHFNDVGVGKRTLVATQ